MRNPFGAAIECLRQGAEAHLSNARHWSELNEFGAAETREKMAVEFESAIRVLEAAGKVTPLRTTSFPGPGLVINSYTLDKDDTRTMAVAIATPPDKEKK